ncbi:DUF742 domain-containing protein [Actinomadura violacea]|uniref:DUF742 domain-containing protein n=1 Tax=Actinomadura violacea TaxID=2819934 RepID=A0ABS3RXN6_9ACTN|nr:DUF742 domain-containing protein [Actinomadura violacea]MBO2461527.1 DUF742 domain-containing protein [Actinomadura violacea]
MSGLDDSPPPAEPVHLVPVYVVTGGRTTPTRNTLQPETLLRTVTDRPSAGPSAPAGANTADPGALDPDALDSGERAPGPSSPRPPLAGSALTGSALTGSAFSPLSASPPGRGLPVTASREQIALLVLCQRQLSVAEVAARLQRPVSVVTVLAADLIDSGLLRFRSPVTVDRRILEEILDGLRAL